MPGDVLALIPEEVHVLKPHAWREQFPTLRQKLDGRNAVLSLDAEKLVGKALVVQFEFLVLAGFFGDVTNWHLAFTVRSLPNEGKQATGSGFS